MLYLYISIHTLIHMYAYSNNTNNTKEAINLTKGEGMERVQGSSLEGLEVEKGGVDDVIIFQIKTCLYLYMK